MARFASPMEEIPVTHNTYAAIKVTKESMISILENAKASATPNSVERLLWALIRHPYKIGETYYFIGGNFLRLQWVDYGRQILTQNELDLLFTYQLKRTESKGTFNPDTNWFAARLRPATENMTLG